MALDGPRHQQALYAARTAAAFPLAPEAWEARAREVLGAGPFHWVAVLGTPSPGPVLLAPVGVLSVVHPDGELAVALSLIHI